MTGPTGVDDAVEEMVELKLPGVRGSPVLEIEEDIDVLFEYVLLVDIDGIGYPG